MDDYREKEDKILSDLLDIENKEIVKILYNFYAEMKDIKRGKMKLALNLMDEISENSESKEKDLLRTILLDSFNDLPRNVLDLIEKIIKLLKE